MNNFTFLREFYHNPGCTFNLQYIVSGKYCILFFTRPNGRMFGMKKSKAEKKVIIALWMAGSPGRKQLAGALRYVNEGHPWSIRLITDPAAFNAATIAEAERDGTDGFLVCVNAAAAPALAASRIPTVLMDFPPPALKKRRRSMIKQFNDEEGIGAKGVDYFASLGNFSSFAFVPDTENRGWSRLRERGFRARLLELGQDCRVYGPGKGSLSPWLNALPKPAAVMASHDFRAKDVLEACRTARLDVPGQISVLGVDNDELICEYSKPSLSSIRIDHEAHGYESARALDRLMRERTPSEVKVRFDPPGDVIERESTKPIPPLTALVNRVRAFIDTHAGEGISVGDVVSHLGVSRRLADLRFHEATGSTIRKAIESRRLEAVTRKLRTTTLSIEKISRLAGYANTQRLKYVFKARFGMSMSEWRNRGCPT